MNTPILTPTNKTVKIISGKELWSDQLAIEIQKLNQKNIPRLTVPTNLTAQAYFIAHLPLKLLQRGLIWFLPSHRHLNEAKEIIDFWLTALDKKSENQTVILEFPTDFIKWITLKSTRTNSLLLVATEHLSLALASPQQITKYTLILTKNDVIKPLTLLNKLSQAGYQPGPIPDSSGWYQKRGDTILVASQDKTWRLHWYNDVLEKIEEISFISGLTIRSAERIIIPPHNLEPSTDNSLINYITNQHTLIAPPGDFLTKHFNAYRTDIGVNHKIFASVPIFAKQWSELGRWLQNKKLAGEKVIIITENPNSLLNLLPYEISETFIYETTSLTSSILSGFHNKKSACHYLTDRELYGAQRPIKRSGLAAYEKLKAGDYLVHIDHGIGKFTGLTQKKADNQTREYFTIEYADNDKLFVPIEHTDRLSRYLGSPNPKLERLSNSHWFRVQKKVKLETTQLARELLKLYAQRHLVEINPWQSFPEEEIIAHAFPYSLTSDQLKTWSEIKADLSEKKPMDRLVCGDVGFGKTELAVRAAARAAFNGYQTAILAPTTILAQQHFDTFSKRLTDYGLKIGLISRAQTPATIKQTLKNLATGKIDIIIGTHRLLANDIVFYRLGLLIIDEEQRFGVKQKEKIRALKPTVHVLALSATPIPRTLNLAVASLRDLSIILSPPAGRQAVQMVFSNHQDDLIKKAITLEINRQGQIYYLVPRIKDLPTAETRIKRLYPQLKLGIIHGRKSPREVSTTMQAFDRGELNLLLATSIIENGLDFPNVNTLIVESAEKFGLADLYQLKGRVGRGTVQAYAYFLTAGKKSSLADKRLEALAQTEELGGGLSLALRDLELRGAGAILGREQHGQVAAVGLHLYGQMLAEAIEEQRTGQTLPAIPEVKLNLPLEGLILPELIPEEEKRIHLYQRLANVRDPLELISLANVLLGRRLTESRPDKLFKNLLTLLEIKLLAEKAKLQEITCWPQNGLGRFTMKFLEKPLPITISRLKSFDASWHQVGETWQTDHVLAPEIWIPWLKKCLKLIYN